MSSKRVGGITRLTIDGVSNPGKGDVTYNLGMPKREPVLGSAGVHGYTEKAQVAFIECATTHFGDLDFKALVGRTDATVIVELPNGQSLVLRNAYYAGDGEGSTAEGELKLKFESDTEAEVIS